MTFDITWSRGSKSVTVARPPALSISPKSTTAIVTVVAGNEAQAMHGIARPYLEAYAKRLGADLVVIAFDSVPAWPMSVKFSVFRALEHYSRIAYFDADILIPEGAVNVFDLCGFDEFGAVDELPFHRFQPQYGIEKKYLAFRKQYGFTEGVAPWYLNLGVYVCPKRYQRLLEPPDHSLPAEHCSEQHLVNARILDGYEKGQVKVRLMDRRANLQNWTDPGFMSRTPDSILHWSSSGQARFSRTEDMQKATAFYPLNPAPPDEEPFTPHGTWPHPAWQIDLRHLRWMHGVLMSGRFRRCLEIGCFHGYSTSAFLDARTKGMILDLHLCDKRFTPRLREQVEHYGHAINHPRTVLPQMWQCDSLDVIGSGANWDLVFVDGDHGEENVRRETELLLGVPAIFAHDTGSAGRYTGCEGPQHLKQAFQKAGYLCLEDNVFRPGERTERGMFFATTDRGVYDLALSEMRKWC